MSDESSDQLDQWLKGRFGRELSDQWLKGRFGRESSHPHDTKRDEASHGTHDAAAEDYNKEIATKLETEVDQWLKGRFGREMDQWLKGRFGDAHKKSEEVKSVKDIKTEKDHKSAKKV